MTYASHYASKLRSKQRERALAKEGSAAVLQDRLSDVIGAVEDMSPAWPELGRLWSEREMEVFRTNGFRKWKPLRTDTILRKRSDSTAAAGSQSEVLVHSGLLKDEVTRVEPRAQGTHFVVFGPQRGAPIDYAKYHMRGNGVPQRNPVPRFRPGERDVMVQALRKYVFGQGAA